MSARSLILAAVVSLMVVAGAAAAELTVADLIRAHEAGVSADVLVQLVRVADALPAIGAEEEIQMLDAGVPRAVVDAVKLRRLELERKGTVASSAEPDDRRLVDVVRLVQAGVSEKVVIEQVQRSEQGYDLSVNDIIYLKDNLVPTTVVSALLQHRPVAPGREPQPVTRVEPVTPTPAPRPVEVVMQPSRSAPEPAPQPILSFGPLLRVTKKAAVIRTSSQGRVLVGDGKIEFRDDSKQKRDVSFFDKALKKVWLECERNPNGDVCFEIRLKTALGDTYRFRDVDWKDGGNAQIQTLFETLKGLYPKVKYRVKSS